MVSKRGCSDSCSQSRPSVPENILQFFEKDEDFRYMYVLYMSNIYIYRHGCDELARISPIDRCRQLL